MSSSPKSSTLRSAIERGIIGGLIFVVVGVIALEMIVRSSTLPTTLALPHKETPVLYDRDGSVIAMLPSHGARTHFVGHLPEMGKWLPEVTVALEDHRFHNHSGIDHYAIVAAAWSNIRGGRLRRGASTVTQQLIKQELGKRGRQWRRKWREAILALKIERTWSKDAILEGYLNRLDYGNRRFGAESASLAYFGKRCAALTLGEAIYLAGLPQAPTRYNPWRNPDNAVAKFRRAIERLTKVGYLTDDQAASLNRVPPRPGNFTKTTLAPHFVNAFQESRGEPLEGAVVTSLDLELQQQADDLLEDHLTNLNRPDIRNGALVVIENATGRVRALSAHATADAMDTSAINAALTPRHAGSTLKPFVYQQALEERRYTLASVLADIGEAVSAIYPDYDPKNYNKRYYGPIRLRQALGNSLNIPAILVSHQLGPRRAFHRLAKWGLQERDPFGDDGAGFVLGNRRVTLLDLTHAYSALARGGLASQTPLFTEHESPLLQRVADRDACRLIEDVLTDNQARTQAFGPNSILKFPRHKRTAVKTGTSSNYRDAWVMGYTDTHTIGVWVGNLDGRAMKDAISVQTAGPIWRRMVDWLEANRQSRSLTPIQPSETLVRVEIDSLTGRLPCPDTASTTREWFLTDTQPIKSGEPWYQEGKITLPQIYHSWTLSRYNHLGAHTSATGESWTIAHPKDGASYVLDPALPEEQQVLQWQTDHPLPECLEWYLNEHPVSGNKAWPLSPGAWILRARDPSSERENKVTFQVAR